MDGFFGLVIVGVLVVVAVVAIRRATGRAGSAEEGPLPGRARANAGLRQPTIEDLRPGDAISFWDGEDDVVEAVVECGELVNGRESTWRWAIVGENRVVETAPDENVLYTASVVYRQGTVPFDDLVAEPEQGGALKTFEERVRDGTIARNPVTIEIADQSWTVESTGTFRLVSVGPLPRREVWRDISTNPADNVYFELSTPDGARGLGLWTTHIALLTGRILDSTDIQSIYPGNAEGQQR